MQAVTHLIDNTDTKDLRFLLDYIRDKCCFLPSLPEEILLQIMHNLCMYDRVNFVKAICLPACHTNKYLVSAFHKRMGLQDCRLYKYKCMAASLVVDIATMQFVDQIKHFSDYLFYALPSILDLCAIITFDWSPFSKNNPEGGVLLSWESVWPHARVTIHLDSVRRIVCSKLRRGCSIILMAAHAVVPSTTHENMRCSRKVLIQQQSYRIYNSRLHQSIASIVNSSCRCGCIPRFFRKADAQVYFRNVHDSST